MSRSAAAQNAEIITVRVSRASKAALGRIAQEEEKSLGEVIRELIRERINRRERLALAADIRRQCCELNEAAATLSSDEASVIRDLDINFDEFAREWK